jgi:hypothetical protein
LMTTLMRDKLSWLMWNGIALGAGRGFHFLDNYLSHVIQT